MYSDVTEDEAKNFLAKSNDGVHQAHEKPPEVDVDEMEQLLEEVVNASQKSTMNINLVCCEKNSLEN